MEYFVSKESIVRQIWGKSDTILFIFAGASAEFALNKAVDWLYFTGRLPADPLARLFSTVNYARRIVFSEKEAAHKAIDTITAIHQGVEKSRGAQIPNWAYRDVLFMLIHYSISSFEVLERRLTAVEKEEVFQVFIRVGSRMNVCELPGSYTQWLRVHAQHLDNDIVKSHYTKDLYKQYRKHLGFVRYRLLLEGQKLVCPVPVVHMLGLGRMRWLVPVLAAYKLLRRARLDNLLKAAVLPPQYKAEIKELDVV